MNRLTGRVVLPGDPGWDDARKAFNQRFDVQPKAVVYCQSTNDVVNAVRWARANGVPFRARSGRHNYEGYSLIQDGLIIDLSDMDEVSVDREAMTAEIGAGIYMLECSEWLGEVGVTIPLATGPTVGLAGLTLGGGFGLTSRRFGLTCDNLVQIELVTADGHVIWASEQHHADLFWACRGGGGGNFGIVTRFWFRVHKVSYVAALLVEWDWSQFEAAVGAWQTWARDVDDALSAALQLTVERRIKLYGLYAPENPNDLSKLQGLLAPLLAAAPPAKPPQIQAPLPFNIAARLFFGEADKTVSPVDPEWAVHVHSDQQIFKSTSAAAPKPLPAAGIAVLKQYLEAVPPLSKPPVQPSMVQLLPGGGAVARVPKDETAVYLRDAQFIVQYDGYWAAPEDGDKTIDWVEAFRTAMLPYAGGAYVNYVDSRLTNYLEAYYGPNLERLSEVKRRYDPHDVFNFPQGIPGSVQRMTAAGRD